IGRPVGAELAAPRELRKLPPVASLKLDGLMARARTGNPMLMTARSEIEAAEGERRLVDKSWYPDVTVTLGGNDLAGIGTRVTGASGSRCRCNGASAKPRRARQQPRKERQNCASRRRV